MKRSLVLFGLIGFSISAALVLKIEYRRGEPRFQGIRASQWTYGVTLANPETSGFKALLAMGPSAVPYILDEYEGEGTKLQRSTWYRKTFNKVPSPLKRFITRPSFTRDEDSKLGLISLLSTIRPVQGGVEEFFVEQLKSNRSQIRFYACEALRSIHCTSERGKKRIGALLKDTVPAVQSSALSALIDLKALDRKMIPELSEIAQHDENLWASQNRGTALYSLWCLKSPDSEEEFGNFLSTESIHAIQPALDKLKSDPETARIFLPLLQKRYKQAKESAEQEFLEGEILQLIGNRAK